MSYKLGLIAGATRLPSHFAYDQGLHVGALVATPGFIKDEANSLNTEVQQMDMELGEERASWGLTPDAQLDIPKRNMDVWWKSVWAPFKVEWAKWWGDHGNSWGLANTYYNFWGSAYEQVQDFRRRLVDLRKSAESVGFYFRGPSPTPPKDNQGLLAALGEAISAFFGKLLWVIVLVGGMVVLVKLIPAGGYHAAGAL